MAKCGMIRLSLQLIRLTCISIIIKTINGQYRNIRLMNKQTVNRHRNHHKTQERRKIWRKRLIEWAGILIFAGSYITVFKLSGCTMGHIPNGLWWYIVVPTALAVIVRAWCKKDLKDNVLMYTIIGFLLGLGISVNYPIIFVYHGK